MSNNLGDSVISMVDEAGTKDWVKLFSQQHRTSFNNRKIRRIEKVPQTLRLIENNKKEYDPVVVSFGPYNHGKEGLHLAEELKRTSLQIYASYCDGRSIEYLHEKVLQVIDFVRGCYVEGSTNEYNNEKFAEMMLLDGCLLLNLIELLVRPNVNFMVMNEHLGSLGLFNLYRDMLLLENQLPYRVLHVLMSIRFDKEDDRNEIFNTLAMFFNIFFYGTLVQSEELTEAIRQYEKQQPLHLLEMYRSHFLSKAGVCNSLSEPESGGKTDLKKYVHSFCSVTEIKAKGILFRACSSSGKFGGDNNINFKSYYLYGELKIPPMVIDQDTKSNLLNLIAYEMCPNTMNDYRVTSYVRFMRMLIQHVDDVKELRTKNILLNFMGRDDEEVVTMFKDIITLPLNVLALQMVMERIQRHYNSKARTWIAELIAKYFSNPWNAIAFLAAFVLLVLSLVQTYFTIYPRKY